ncbi:hypothetical protein shim_15430 [Shimia sp. SK013]|uniref:aKG-HExxH-type peptide beta-hydroxylase n=1 Tax=Shimia sp. SK013 TaxID=1389006 RepID=UPI0006CDC8DD|nr:HEXXH motif-containing putative peptide modification protein [Shimia sp. SK013]KPA23247.1 hypothetical protein shim_15430 [Shimia sp. SK013]
MENLVYPDPKKVSQTRAEIQVRILESFNHLIFEFFSEHYRPPVSKDALVGLISSDEKFPSPAVFALHGALVKTALEDDQSKIPALYRTLAEMVDRGAFSRRDICVTPLSAPPFHKDDLRLLSDAYSDDVGLTADLQPPSLQETKAAVQMIEQAVELLSSTRAPWGEELILLANEVVLAVPGPNARSSFGGAAVFDAFGSVLMNPRMLHDTPSTALSLVHETSHQQMFLFHLDDPVILNDEQAVYQSPLRKQSRPMEGIFHAMWVSGRMAQAANDIMVSAPSENTMLSLSQLKDTAITSFRDCAETVADHALLSEFGTKLFTDARAVVNEL